jgi:hypothetical protein
LGEGNGTLVHAWVGVIENYPLLNIYIIIENKKLIKKLIFYY